MVDQLEDTFSQFMLGFNVHRSTSLPLWYEIKEAHSSNKRHYHTLNHLSHIISELTPLQKSIENWNSIMLAIFYHDIVYKVTRKDNEEKSALLAKERLTTLSIPVPQIEICYEAILATKSHDKHALQDINYLTDADLAILGSEHNTYIHYTNQIRKEYSIFPDILYKKGRKKVLEHFLNMEYIYKTDYFHNQYHDQCISNLKNELLLLK